MKILGVIVASLCALAASAAEKIEFAGYAVVSGERLFSVHKPDENEFSPWLKIGQEWSGYKTVSFDDKGEKLTLSKDGMEQALWLRAAEIGREFTTIPYLVKGSFTLLDGTVVYSDDAVVKVGPVFVSAVAGVLVSDREQTQLVGDFKMSTDTFEATFENGRVTKKGDEVVVTADKFTMENKH